MPLPISAAVVTRLNRDCANYTVDWTLDTLANAVSKSRLTAEPGLVFQAPWDAVAASRFLESALVTSSSS